MLIKCFKCVGRKKMYKVNNVYSLQDFSGVKPVDCPECGGIGKVLSEDEKVRVREEKAAKDLVAKGSRKRKESV